MDPTKISSMRPPVTDPSRPARRDQRLLRTIQARRRLDSPRPGGRAWINGREVGGPNPRYAHLSGTYD